MACEKCWWDAGGDYELYLILLKERKDKPCSPEQQAGDRPVTAAKGNKSLQPPGHGVKREAYVRFDNGTRIGGDES